MEQLISAATMPYWATIQVFTAKTFTTNITIRPNLLSKM